jgi:hypothetical protein
VAPVVKLLSRLEEIKRLDLMVVAATEDDTTKIKMWHSSQTQTPTPTLRIHNSEHAYSFKNKTNTMFKIIFFSIDISQTGVSAQADCISCEYID